MQVLLVVEPGIDGVFRHVEGLVRYLMRQPDVRVHLAYSDCRGSAGLKKLVQTVADAGGETLNLRVNNGPAPADAPAFFKLASMARRVRPDIIHGHSSKAGVLVRALRFIGWQGPLFYTPHAYYGLAPRPSRVATALFNGIEQAFGKIGTTINISPDEATFARESLGVPASRIRTIHNPVDTEIFQPPTPEQRQRARQQLGLPEDAIILGAIGRLSFQKDPQMLYRAFAAVVEREPRLRLFHVGQGELADELATLAAELNLGDRLIRKSYLDNPACFYEAIDALAVTSRYEAGWPIVTLEALACNLPLVAVLAPGTTDLAASGLSHCWTSPVEAPTAFSQSIAAWLADRDLARPCNHRERAIERFSVERCFGGVLAEYRSAQKV